MANPLQCSCLENPRDGGIWRAAIHGVTQSQTRLKRLSSSCRVDLQNCVTFRCTAEVFQLSLYVSIFVQILFSYKLSQNVEQSSLCYSVGPCRSSYIQRYVCLFIQTPDLSLWQPQLCYACESVSVLQIGSLVSYFRFHI